MILAFLLALSCSATDWIDSFLAGSRALERDRASEARSAFEQAWADLPDHAPTAWQLAGTYARLGDPSAAFEWLERSVALGGGEAALLAWDPDLESLRADPRFALIAEVLRARADDSRSVEPAPVDGRLALAGGGASLSIGPDARVVAIGRGADTLLFDTVADEIVATLDRPGERNAWARVSPDGRHVVASGSAGERNQSHYLRIFDAATGDFDRELDGVGWQADVQFSHDGQRMLAYGAAHFGGVRVWDTANWTTLPSKGLHGDQYVLSGDGTRILVLQRGAMSSDVELWDVDGARPIQRLEKLQTIPNTDMRFSDDSALALILENGTGRSVVLDGHTGERVATIEPPQHSADQPTPREALCSCACFLGTTGEIALMNGRRDIEIRDARSGELRRAFRAPGKPGWGLVGSLAGGSAIVVHGLATVTCVLDAQSGEVLWLGTTAVRVSA